MHRVFAAAALVVALVGFSTAAAASPVLDFRQTGSGLGTMKWNTDGSVSGTNIPIGELAVTGTSGFDGAYTVTGGSLSFSTGGLAGTNHITITGCVTIASTSVCGTLLSGTISSYSIGNSPINTFFTASGPDTKNPDLLAALGIPINQAFSFFGFSATSTLINPGGSTGSVISTDITNAAVPEPTSLLLLGSGLLGLGAVARRRLLKRRT